MVLACGIMANAEPLEPRHRAKLEEQLTGTVQVWRLLTERHGVKPGTALQLRVYYYGPGREPLETLQRALDARAAYTWEPAQPAAKVVSPEQAWVLVGLTEPLPLTSEFLLRWNAELFTAGVEHGCVFDGWEAKLR